MFHVSSDALLNNSVHHHVRAQDNCYLHLMSIPVIPLQSDMSYNLDHLDKKLTLDPFH